MLMPDRLSFIRPESEPDGVQADAWLYSYLDGAMFGNLGQAKKYLGQAAKMLIGIPDYDNYVDHMKTNHPDKPYMTYNEFFRERQEARYGSGGSSCC